MAFLTTPFFSIICSILIFASPWYFAKKLSPTAVTNLAATLGIFGTFLGIFAGLLGFHVHDIEGSVPILLEGLKTAFLTSLAGMAVGIIIKVRPQMYGFKLDDTAAEKDGTEAVLSLLADIKNLNEKQITTQTTLLKNVEKALCGDGDTTVLTQLQKLRTSFTDKQDELIKEFKTFAQTMAENNSKALIDALTQVMRDFNAKINEQFGENFKRLNEAVEKILVWQEKYKEEVEQMIIAFDKCLQGVEQSERNLAEINKHADRFTTIAEELEAIIEELHYQKGQVQAGLNGFAEVAKDAKTALPTIKEEVNRLTTGFTETVSAALAEISLSVTTVNDAVKNQTSALEKTQDSLNNNLDAMMRSNAERIARQVEELDKALGEELTKSLTALSSQLQSLSTKFVSDYSPLTDKLRDVVAMAKQVNN